MRHAFATAARRAKISSDARDRLLGHRPRDTKALHYEDEDEVLPLLAEEIAKIPALLDDGVVFEVMADSVSDGAVVDQEHDEQHDDVSYAIKPSTPLRIKTEPTVEPPVLVASLVAKAGYGAGASSDSSMISAEEEGFEPTVPLRVRRFSNSVTAAAMGCTDGNPRESEPSATKKLAPSGTERHRDQTSDQAPDQATKPIFGRDLEAAAERLLRAVAEGAAESVELAKELVVAVLGDPMVRRAVALDELLRRQSPLALVRAVELAEALLGASHITRSRAGT